MITITDDCAQTSALHAPILPFHVTPAAPVLPPARSCHPCPSLPFAVACLIVVTLQNQHPKTQDTDPCGRIHSHIHSSPLPLTTTSTNASPLPIMDDMYHSTSPPPPNHRPNVPCKAKLREGAPGVVVAHVQTAAARSVSSNWMSA